MVVTTKKTDDLLTETIAPTPTEKAGFVAIVVNPALDRIGTTIGNADGIRPLQHTVRTHDYVEPMIDGRDRKIPQFEFITLYAGANFVDASLWAQAKAQSKANKHDLIGDRLSLGVYREFMPRDGHDSTGTPADFSPIDAAQLIQNTYSIDVLKGWANIETRREVIETLRARMEQLQQDETERRRGF